MISTETFCVCPVGKKKANSATKPSVILLVLPGRAIALNPTVVNVEWVGLDPIVPIAYAYPDASMGIVIRLLNANVNLDGKECSVTSVRISAILGVLYFC